MRPFGGTIKSDGQSLTFDHQGQYRRRRGDSHFDAKQTANGIALNARVQLSGVDGAALRYRGLAMPAGRTSMQMTLGAIAFELLTGRRPSGTGQDIGPLTGSVVPGADRLQAVLARSMDENPGERFATGLAFADALASAGALAVASAQIPFNVREGRLRVGATTLDAEGARAIVSGGYDIPADQADIRVVIASTTVGAAASRPEIWLFAVGAPNALNRTVDVAALSSWLAVRAIDRETRRLDSIERGEPPPRTQPRTRTAFRFPTFPLPAAVRTGFRRSPGSARRIRC